MAGISVGFLPCASLSLLLLGELPTLFSAVVCGHLYFCTLIRRAIWSGHAPSSPVLRLPCSPLSLESPVLRRDLYLSTCALRPVFCTDVDACCVGRYEVEDGEMRGGLSQF